MNKYFKFIVIVMITIILISGLVISIKEYQKQQKLSRVFDFDTCVEENFIVQESYPRVCRTPDGTSYTEEIEVNCQSFGFNDCPIDCGVCPSCETCSSLSCQDKDTCLTAGFDEEWQTEIRNPSHETQSATSLRNPSINCMRSGGTLDIRNNGDNQISYCVFPDGHECEEWALFRGECK